MIKKLKVTKKNDDDILILNNDKVIRDIKYKRISIILIT